MVKLVDTFDLGSSGEIGVGSSPSSRTLLIRSLLLTSILSEIIQFFYSVGLMDGSLFKNQFFKVKETVRLKSFEKIRESIILKKLLILDVCLTSRNQFLIS